MCTGTDHVRTQQADKKLRQVGKTRAKSETGLDLVFGALGESLKAFKQEDKEGCIVWEDDPARRVQDGEEKEVCWTLGDDWNPTGQN